MSGFSSKIEKRLHNSASADQRRRAKKNKQKGKRLQRGLPGTPMGTHVQGMPGKEVPCNCGRCNVVPS